MLKNFSQKFEVERTGAFLLIKDDASKKFLCFESAGDAEDYSKGNAYRTLYFQFDPQHEVVNQLGDCGVADLKLVFLQPYNILNPTALFSISTVVDIL